MKLICIDKHEVEHSVCDLILRMWIVLADLEYVLLCRTVEQTSKYKLLSQVS